VDFKLMPESLLPQSAAGESSANIAPEPRTPPKFAAAGVRGLIDPGGYSAAANAAATSGLIEGIAGIKRAGNGIGALTAASWPCGVEAQLETAVRANPNQAEANRRLGEFYIAHGQPNQAIPFLQKAREIDPADDLAARDLGVAWIESGQFDSARQWLTGLAERLPTPEIHRLLARALEGARMFPQAAEQYHLAADDEPSEENFFGMGYELILAGLPAEAANAFRLGLKQHRQSIQLLIGAGTAEFLQGHSSEGLVSFLQASDLNPSDPRPYSFLSSASGISEAEGDRVRQALKRFLDLAPGNAEASYFYAVSLAKSPDAQEAAVAASVEAGLKRALALNPALAKAHMQLGVFYGERGDHKDAAIEYEAAVRLAPGLKEAHYRLAGAYRRTGRPELAAREMQLFLQARASESAGAGDSDIGIEQFLSVIEPPGSPKDGAGKCPVGAR
jgi:tetratricopeptide (TPR) repeat protein